MNRVIFTGGRDYKKRHLVAEALSELNPNDVIIVHGAAPGLDTIVGEEAEEFGFEVEPYPAEWSVYGHAAGPIRNRHMLRQPNVIMVVAFPGNVGTADMVKAAKKAGVLVVNGE